MAIYIDEKRVLKGRGNAFDAKHKLGDNVPYSGIYECLGCKKEIAANKGDPFPPQNRHQHTAAQGEVIWQLIVYAQTEGKNP